MSTSSTPPPGRSGVPDLGDFLRFQPERTPDRYACRHCGALVDSSRVDKHAAFHLKLDELLRAAGARGLTDPEPTAPPSDSPAPGPTNVGP